MPAQHLVMFKRAIFPLVAWVNRQQRFYPNWEVEKIVRIPLAALFDKGNYARFRISFAADTPEATRATPRDMPCFVHRQHGQRELLWGATYRITAQFLQTTFGFSPPEGDRLPAIHRQLDRRYVAGNASP